MALTKQDVIGRAKKIKMYIKIIPNLHTIKKLEKSADYIEVAKPFSLNPIRICRQGQVPKLTCPHLGQPRLVLPHWAAKPITAESRAWSGLRHQQNIRKQLWLDLRHQ